MSVVKCGRCKNFIEKDDSIQRGIQRFCAEGCEPVAVKKPKKRKSEVSNDLRNLVYSLDGGMCRMCGRRYGVHLDIHHVIYRSEGGPHEQSNLITLCSECHGVVHSDKSRFQKLCLGIIWLRILGDKTTTILSFERKLK